MFWSWMKLAPAVSVSGPDLEGGVRVGQELSRHELRLGPVIDHGVLRHLPQQAIAVTPYDVIEPTPIQGRRIPMTVTAVRAKIGQSPTVTKLAAVPPNHFLHVVVTLAGLGLVPRKRRNGDDVGRDVVPAEPTVALKIGGKFSGNHGQWIRCF
jgi:hypothetical protein